jgi:hypothetical protein
MLFPKWVKSVLGLSHQVGHGKIKLKKSTKRRIKAI